jgi:endonuclease I
MSDPTRRLLLAATLALSLTASTRAQFDAPATYFSSITTQTGSALKSQLTTIMSSGHVQSSYAEARDFLPFTDANPNDATQMFEFYGHAVIQKPSASHVGFVGVYDSREHVWPDSLQGSGNTSNSTRGSRGDIHMLKPLRQSTNSSRGNNAFGGPALTGVARNIGGSQWFPSDVDKGDAARIIFYGATRYQSTLSVVNGNPTTNTQMGDLNALMHFHYLDTPDLFEQRRNDTIYRGDDVRTSGDDSSFGGTRNRNAFIDRPEYAWSVFVDQQNDARLSVGTPSADGGSALNVDFGRVLRDAPTPASQNVTLNKAGVDGTYYSVTAVGAATSTVNGHYNAFAMDAAGSRVLGIGLNASTGSAGLKSGTVTIDNLDVTTQGGAGRGANDANDVIATTLSVLDASNPSFATGSDSNTLVLDFGSIASGSGALTLPFSVSNLSSALGSALTARLDLDFISVAGDAGAFDIAASSFTNLTAGTSRSFTAEFDPTAVGAFSAAYTFHFSDENLPGTVATSQLTLNLLGTVTDPSPSVFAYNVDADGDYSVASNFTGNTVPTGTNGRVLFGSVITAPRSVNVDLDISLTSITFDSAHAYTLNGAQTIQLLDNDLSPAVRVLSGEHVINAALVLESSTRFDIADNASLSVRGSVASDSGIVKLGDGLLEISPTQFTSLEVRAGTLKLIGNGVTKATEVMIESGSLLDVAGSVLIVDYDGPDSPLNVLKSKIADGSLSSSAMPGSSWSIGYVDAASLGIAEFEGMPLDGTSLIFLATLKGDANLSRTVDFDDLLALAQHYGTSDAEWFDGDSDQNGIVNFDDLLALAQNYGTGTSLTREQFQDDWQLARSMVPEPTSLTVIAVAFLPRRRTRAAR